MTAPSIPFAVQKYLNDKGLDYRPRPMDQASKLVRIEVTVLQDEKGLLQVFFPSNCLLDLNKLQRNLGRNMRAIAQQDLNKLKQKEGLDNLPALSGFLNIESVIDEKLQRLQEFNLYSGSQELLIQVKSNPFPGETEIVDVCVEVPQDSMEYELSFFEQDEVDINKAVKNFTTLRIQQRLEETLEIPPLPESAQAIIRLRVDPNADINKLSRIVENDPSLAAQVVSWASSSYYSAPGSVKSVQDAIIRVLGYDLVMNLALGLALGKTLDLPKDGPEGVTPYWSQAVYTAAAIGGLINLIPRELRPSFGLAYLSGLLHNFGYLIMAHSFKPHFSACCRSLEANRHMGSQHIEKHLIGITREQIGASLLKSWNLPAEVTTGVRFQNDPVYQGPNADYSALTYVATRLLWQYGLVKGPVEVIDPEVFGYLHMEASGIPEVMEQIMESRAELDQIASGMSE